MSQRVARLHCEAELRHRWDRWSYDDQALTNFARLDFLLHVTIRPPARAARWASLRNGRIRGAKALGLEFPQCPLMRSFPDAGMRRPHPRWAADVRKLAQIRTLPYCRCSDRCRRRPSCAALTMRPVISPLATASTRSASRRASCSLRSAAALSRDRLREPRPFLGKAPAGGLNHRGVS